MPGGWKRKHRYLRSTVKNTKADTSMNSAQHEHNLHDSDNSLHESADLNMSAKTQEGATSSQKDIALILEQLNKVNTKMEQLTTMNENIDKLCADFEQMKKDIQDLKKTKEELQSVKQTANDAHDIALENQVELNSVKNDVSELEGKLQKITIEANEAKTALHSLKYDHAKLDTYIRRDNLIIQQVPVKHQEDCDSLVRGIFKQMKVDGANHMRFVRVHRLKGNSQDPPPIICRFSHYEDRMKVWQKRGELKGTKTIIQEDFHPFITERRKTLYPVLKAARELHMKCTLAGDRLVIEGKSYTPETLHKLPETLQPFAVGMKESTDVVAFFTNRCPLSNFHKTKIKDGEYEYHSTEQYLQHNRALFAGDEVTASKILKATEPIECKNLAKSVKNLNVQQWETAAFDIMKKGLLLKFKSDGKCRETLLQTGDRTIGEATSSDHFWGTGVALGDTHATNPGVWKGHNMMGKALEEVREQIREIYK